MRLMLVLVVAAGGCSASTPSENSSDHTYDPCVDGQTRCGDGEVVQHCQGGQWVVAQACADAELTCVNAQCVGENAPPVQQVLLQNGVAGYNGCTDVTVSVPAGSGFYETTPEDETLYIYHWVWTGS